MSLFALLVACDEDQQINPAPLMNPAQFRTSLKDAAVADEQRRIVFEKLKKGTLSADDTKGVWL